MTHLILCGLPASGKTTIGKTLATSMQRRFIDIDTLIEESYAQQHLSCCAIYRKEGPAFFRELEKRVILDLNPSSASVIACGGGSLHFEESVAHLKRLGKLIYLDAPIPLLWDRLIERGLPAYLHPENPRKHFEEIAQMRISLYQKAADIMIDIRCSHLQELLIGIAHGQQCIRNRI